MKSVLRPAAALAVGLSAAFLVPACSDDPADPGPSGCDVTVTSPEAGATLYTDRAGAVRWSDPGGGRVRISLRRAGAELGVIAADTGNDGYHPWDITEFGAGTADDFVIRVAEIAADTACYGDSPPVTIIDADACSLAFTNPWRTRLTVGDTLELAWSGGGGSGGVDLWLLHVGVPADIVAEDLPVPGAFTWEADLYGRPAGLSYNLVVVDRALESCLATSPRFALQDPDPCTISVSSPVTGQELTEGAVFRVAYSVQRAGGPLTLLLYTGSTRLGTVATGLSIHEGGHDWTVTDLGHDDDEALYFLRLVDDADPDCWNTSGEFFIR